MLSAGSLRLINNAITRVIRTDPESAEYFSLLDNHVFVCTIQSPIQLDIYIEISCGAITLSLSPHEAEPCATFSASAFEFMSLANSSASAQSSNIKISGDHHAAELLFNWFRKLNIDWEGLIANAVGNEAAVILSAPLKTFFNWKRSTIQDFSATVTEYLQHESNSLPCKDEVQLFNENVRSINADLGRLEARINYLGAK